MDNNRAVKVTVGDDDEGIIVIINGYELYIRASSVYPESLMVGVVKGMGHTDIRVDPSCKSEVVFGIYEFAR